ncbi:MAG: TIM barrel protein [Thermoplasmata archaeon]
MLFFGPAGLPASCSSAEEAVNYLAGIGLNALEIEFVHGVRMGLEEALRVRKLAEERGVLLSAHAPYYINLAAVKEDTRKRSRARILSTMRVAHALGAKIIVVHAGYYFERDVKKTTQVIAEELSICREAADVEGWGDVFIGLETMGRKASWGTLDEIRVVARRVRGVVPVVDFAHIHARCGGCLKSREAFERVLEEYESLAPPFLHSHFTGVEWGQSGERRHLALRSGEPDFSLLAPALLNRHYDVTVISESPLLELDATAMRDMALGKE